MINIHTYRDKQILLSSRSSQYPAENVFADKMNRIMTALGKLLSKAEPILFKDGSFRKPGLLGALKLGWITITFIKEIFSNEG